MEKEDGILIPQDGECVVSKFTKKEVRKIFHQSEWWHSIVDVIEALVETDKPTEYWRDLKNKLEKQVSFQFSDNFKKLKLPSKKDSGNEEDTDCINMEGILHVVQSIPSEKAESFKRWLAKTGFERIQEKANPELAIRRAMLDYELQGRGEKWIQDRVNLIDTRKKLTNEWRKRGVKEGREYGTLTNEISKGTFGIEVKQHKEIKNLKEHHNLRDNMSSTELIFQRLGEEATIGITKERNAKGFKENKKASKDGGESAGEARIAYEKRIGKRVVTSQNYLQGVKEKEIPTNTGFKNDLKNTALSKKKSE